MSNCLFGWPIVSDLDLVTPVTPVLSGGSWQAALPLTNLQDRRVHRVARAADAALASTTFDLDLTAVTTFRLAALLGHNFSTAAKARVRSYITKPILDSATVGGAGWTAVGTPTRAAAAHTASGIPLDLIGDDDGAGWEAYYQAITFTGDAVKVISLCAKEGVTPSASGTVINLFDVTVTLPRLVASITWVAGVPSVGMAEGTLLSTTALGSGVYRFLFLTTAVTAANDNRLYVSPASEVVAATGDVYAGDVQAWNAATDQCPDDSKWVAAWPTGMTAAQMGTFKPPFVYIASANITTARYLRVGLDDTTNADGYVEAGRLVIAPAFQPTINLSYGAAHGFESESTRTPTDGGAFIHGERPRRRALTGTLADLPQDEALANLWEMQRQLGTTGQFLFVFDPADTTHLWRRSFLAVFRDLSPMEMASLARYSTPIGLVEDL